MGSIAQAEAEHHSYAVTELHLWLLGSNQIALKELSMDVPKLVGKQSASDAIEMARELMSQAVRFCVSGNPTAASEVASRAARLLRDRGSNVTSPVLLEMIDLLEGLVERQPKLTPELLWALRRLASDQAVARQPLAAYKTLAKAADFCGRLVENDTSALYQWYDLLMRVLDRSGVLGRDERISLIRSVIAATDKASCSTDPSAIMAAADLLKRIRLEVLDTNTPFSRSELRKSIVRLRFRALHTWMRDMSSTGIVRLLAGGTGGAPRA